MNEPLLDLKPRYAELAPAAGLFVGSRIRRAPFATATWIVGASIKS
jgi:hypothetical protein